MEKSIRLPAGLTAEAVIRSVVPEHDEKLKVWEETRKDDQFFRVSLSEGLQSDLGMAGRRFFLFAVAGQAGICAQCYFWRVGVLDVPTRKLVFRHDSDGAGPAPAVKVFRLSDTRLFSSSTMADQRYCVAFRTGIASLNGGGYSRTVEEWYRPLPQADGSLLMQPLWSDVVERAQTDNVSWESTSACGRMAALKTPGEYEYRVKEAFGVVGAESAARRADRDSGWTWDESCVCEHCGVEIREVARFDYDGNGLAFRARSRSRVDLFPVSRFPFNLRVRKNCFRLLESSGDVDSLERDGIMVTSPAGDRQVILETPANGRQTLTIERAAGGDPLRKIAVTAGVFSDGVESVGWEKDGQRVFVVLKIGERASALLSFSVTGTDDYWEDLVPPDWPLEDGFVLIRTKAKRSERSSTSHRGRHRTKPHLPKGTNS